jgi:hypothetical protein
MALRNCRECGGKVSTTAAACPHCGAPNRTVPPPLPQHTATQSKPKKAGIGTLKGCLAVVVVFFVAVFGIGLIGIFSGRTGRDADSVSTASPEKATTGIAININQEIPVPSDTRAKYYFLEKGGTADRPTLTTKRAGPSGISYSKRLFDCDAQTFRYLGEGDSIEAMERTLPNPDEKMSDLVEGSISWWLWSYACDK